VEALDGLIMLRRACAWWSRLLLLSMAAALTAGSCKRVPPPSEVAESRNHAPPPLDFLLVPGVRAGPVTRCVSESALVSLIGPTAVRSERVVVAEGEDTPGTILFPQDSAQSVIIIWRDTVARRFPGRIETRGRSTLWHTQDGITVGTAAATLEQLNGGPFHLAGFGWDYSGVFRDWAGGRLDSLYDRRLSFYLDTPLNVDTKEDYDSLLGGLLSDRSFSSDLPAMRRLNLRVISMILLFPDEACRAG